MANVTRLNEAFDSLLRGYFLRPMAFEGDRSPPQVATFPVDVSEDELAYTVRAEIPGVKKEDINVSVEGNQVAISADLRPEEVKEDERVLRSERYYGKAYRALHLAQPVFENAAVAKYTDGVLELTLPKRAPTSAKRIKIM